MNLIDLERMSPGDWFYDVRDQLKWHVYRRAERAFAAGDAARDALASVEDVRDRQRAIRESFLASLGGLPSMDTPLAPVVSGIEQLAGFRLERLTFQSRPRHYVSANLYLPDGLERPTGAVLFLCGHAPEGKGYPEYQAVCQCLATAGLVVLAQDPIGQGERYSYWEAALGHPTVGPCCPEHDYAGAQCAAVGDSIARYFLHDAMRSVDYLSSRPEVDSTRIGVTGNSGGGTQSCLMMLGDPRIAAAAPGTFIMNRRTYMHSGGAQDAEQIWPGFSARGYDHEDVLIAMAPRPVRVLAVTHDFFPIEGTRGTVARCKRVWGLFGAEDHVDLVEDVASHAYTRPLAIASTRFFTRHLLGAEAGPDEARVAPLPVERTWATPTGQVRAHHADAAAAYEANCARLAEATTERLAEPADRRRALALGWLRGRVMGNRQACELNPRPYCTTRFEDLAVEARIWWSQPDLLGHGLLFRSVNAGTNALPLTLAVWDGGTNSLRAHIDWIRATCDAGRAVLVVDASGCGALAPHSLHASYPPDEFYGVQHKLSDDLTWLDDDMASLRTYDVLRSLDAAELWPGLDVAGAGVYCHGRHGVYGRLAGAIDPRFGEVTVGDGLETDAEWVNARHYDTQHVKTVIVRGMLRHFDLPDLAIRPTGGG